MNNPFLNTQKAIENPLGYKVLTCISMFYMSIMLCNAVLTNRYIGTDLLFVLGGTFTSPLVFIFDDIIAEIYGYKIAKAIIITGFLAQTFFVVVCQMVLLSPSPSFFHHQESYNYVLGVSLLRITISGFIAYIFANLMNSYILTRWKVLLKGRHFWLRSIGSSTFSEMFYSFVAIIMMELASIPLKDILQVAAISFSIKAIYSMVLACPANILVNYLKRITGVDQAGLLTATELGIEIGGWCPKGGLDENGLCILNNYPLLKEATTSDPAERTKLNIRDSDGTLIIVPTMPLPDKIKDGTQLTIDYAIQLKKPHLIIRLDKKEEAVEILREWVSENDIRVLNVGGPRESNSPGINLQSCELFQDMFAGLKPTFSL